MTADFYDGLAPYYHLIFQDWSPAAVAVWKSIEGSWRIVARTIVSFRSASA